MKKDFDKYLQIAPILKDMLQEDLAVTVADISSILHYTPGDSIDLHIKVGDIVPLGGDINKTLDDGKIRSSIVSKEVLGVPFRQLSIR
jgi:hypothetical protein